MRPDARVRTEARKESESLARNLRGFVAGYVQLPRVADRQAARTRPQWPASRPLDSRYHRAVNSAVSSLERRAAVNDSDALSKILAIESRVAEVVRGKPEVIELCLVALIGGGHLLVEDIPGVGKSTLARTLAFTVGGDFRRIQFTSDLLPSDIVGVNVWRAQAEHFEFRPGPVFANFVLADEINRAPPRTQSALLEAMGETQVSVDGVTHALPQPFMVMATQNPHEHHGTYPLPESQRDRFMLRLSLGYLAPEIEAALLVEHTEAPAVEPLIAVAELLEPRQAARAVFLHPDLARYAQAVAAATRSHAAVRLGVSTRGALAWVAAARARAWLRGRTQVAIDDLQDLATAALAHRLMTGSGGDDVLAAEDLVREILATVPVPV